MKKLICILASAALFGACEQKTDVAPTASLVPEKKTDKAVDPNQSKKPTLTSAVKTETATEPTTTTTSSPTP